MFALNNEVDENEPQAVRRHGAKIDFVLDLFAGMAFEEVLSKNE